MLLYFQQQLFFLFFFIISECLTWVQPGKDSHPSLDVKWSNDNTTEYVGLGHTFASRASELHMEWRRSSLEDPFIHKTNPITNTQKFDIENPPKSNEPMNESFLQPHFSYPNSRPQVSCNVVVQNLLFYLYSPLYPEHYPERFHCFYLFKKAINVCTLELDIRDFYLEPTVGCSKDWLRIGDRRYCGFHRPRKLLVPANKFEGQHFRIEFHSDSIHQFRGFYITGQQIPCRLTPSANPSVLKMSERPFRPNVFFTRPFPSPYPTRPAVSVLPPPNLVIKQHRLPPTPSLISSQHKVLSHYPIYRPNPPYTPPTYTSHPSVTFPTTPTHTLPPSTTASFPSCDVTFNSIQEGQFQSMNYPKNYGPNLSCDIRFVPTNKSFCALELYFQDFLLERSKGCWKDALIIGGNRYCSSSLTDQRLRISFVSQSSISLQFVTDATGNERGFQLRFRMLPCEGFSTTLSPNTTPPGVTCDRIFSDRENTITSVNYPLPYLKNLDCIYTVEKWSLIVDELEIHFVVFDLQNGTDCFGDYLQIVGTRYCGVQTGLRFRLPFSGDDPLEILFHSDGSVQQTGFEISILQLDQQVTSAPVPTTPLPASLCSTEIFGESSFLIISPQFPHRYAPGQDCNYSVQRKSKDVCELQLKFVFFYLTGEADTYCREDYLEINNTRYCGVLSGQTRNFPFYGDNVDISFHSDFIDNEAQGFSIHVVQLTDCTASLAGPTPLPPRIKEPRCPVSLLPNQGNPSTGLQPINITGCTYVKNEELGMN